MHGSKNVKFKQHIEFLAV